MFCEQFVRKNEPTICQGSSMNQVPFHGDVRITEHCAYCAGGTTTRDHVPSRVLLDEPYPANLPTVPSCIRCNEGASTDEAYAACLIDCALTASTRLPRREKIGRILSEKPTLAGRLARQWKLTADGDAMLAMEGERLRRVVRKLARGHTVFELNEAQYGETGEAYLRADCGSYIRFKTCI